MSLEERNGTLFEADILASHEFAGGARAGHRPEERLMLAVLGDALFCFQKYHLAGDKPGRRMFADAEGWVLDENDQWPFSFVNICSTLGISPGYLRGRLTRWKVRQLRRVRRTRPGMKLRSL